MEIINLFIAIGIFIVCVIVGYFADKKLKLDETIDKKMKDIDKNGLKKEENIKVEDKKSTVVNPQSNIQTNKQSNIVKPVMQNNMQPNINVSNQNINNNNNINGPILTSENIIEEEINNVF